MEITKKEWVAIGVFFVFALFWAFLVLPFLQGSEWFRNLPAIFAYPLYNFGFILFYGLFFGVLLTYALKKRIAFIPLAINAILAFFVVANVYDLWQGPFTVNATGCLMPFAGDSLSNTAIDSFYHGIFSGITGQACSPWFYPLIYFLIPILTIMALAFFSYLEIKDIL